MNELPTTYWSESKKRDVPIREMHMHHLENAVKKIAMEATIHPNDADTAALLRALSIEVDRRLAGTQQEEQHEHPRYPDEPEEEGFA
jgi:hypothetical protein